MRITTDRLIRLRWLLLGAVGAGACGGTVHSTPDDGGSGGEAVAGKGNAHAGSSAATGGEKTMGGEASSAGSGGTGGTAVGGHAGEAGSGGFAGVGGTGVVHGECVDPQPYGAGFVSCMNGPIHRVAALECANNLPTEPVTCGVAPNPQYVCDGSKREHCATAGLGAPVPNTCEVGCAVDADCSAGQLCLCGAQTGVCVAAACTVDADCGDGYFCRRVQTELPCGAVVHFQCELPSDTCGASVTCGVTGQRCQPSGLGGPMHCAAPVGGTCGRPFLVNGAPRLACLATNADWAAPLELDASALAARTRSALAEGWNELGLMEHASVAAFARFTLQLLGLGAPHALVLESNRALCDEMRHAELCFGLAASFGSVKAGPGKLDSRGALARTSLEDVVLDTFLEGCIGETVAALEASEALSCAGFSVVREVLEQISEDEARHAALAWRFVAWGVAQVPALADNLRTRLQREQVRAEADSALAQHPSSASDALAVGGLLSERGRAELRLQALREVVAPCLAALPAPLRADAPVQALQTS